jgi:hypothetical protein
MEGSLECGIEFSVSIKCGNFEASDGQLASQCFCLMQLVIR